VVIDEAIVALASAKDSVSSVINSTIESLLALASAGVREESGCPSVGPDESPYAATVRALLENGPMQGKTVEVEAVEGRPPKTIDVPDEKGGTYRYCLAQWSQEGMTAAYTFLYAV